MNIDPTGQPYEPAEIEGARKPDPRTVELLARAFHEEYERLAPLYNYKTRPESAVPWSKVPHENKSLMISTIRTVIERGEFIVVPADTARTGRYDGSDMAADGSARTLGYYTVVFAPSDVMPVGDVIVAPDPKVDAERTS